MNIVPSKDPRYAEYEKLILKRDALKKEAAQIRIVYLQLFGALIADNYREKLECIKCKKIISYYQNALNHGGEVDRAAMEEYLDRELAVYREYLTRLLEENEAAENAGTSTEVEAKKAAKIYRRLAKLIHPDICPAARASAVLAELWLRITEAYRCNDAKALEELEFLVKRALEAEGEGVFEKDIPDIEDRIRELKEETEEIVSTEPYVFKYITEDPEAAQAKKAEKLSRPQFMILKVIRLILRNQVICLF